MPADLPLLDVDPEASDWRWPLPRAPQISPSAELSDMFGIREAWTTLCSARRDPRGVDRDEAISYLRAWCDAPPDLALAKALVPLIRARTSQLATAAMIDLAAVLESQVGAGEALAWLRRHNASDSAMLDALAATYLSSDRPDDVRAVIKVLPSGYGIERCRRLFRELFVADRPRRETIRSDLRAAGTDVVCTRLSAHASCTLSWGVQARGTGAVPAQVDLDRCMPILLQRPELSPHAYLTIAAAHWPASRAFEDWLGFATFTLGAVGAPRADELIGAAFDNAVRMSDCDGQLDQLRVAVERVPIDRLRPLATLTRAECELRKGKPDR
jgi:hypothetical protein